MAAQASAQAPCPFRVAMITHLRYQLRELISLASQRVQRGMCGLRPMHLKVCQQAKMEAQLRLARGRRLMIVGAIRRTASDPTDLLAG